MTLAQFWKALGKCDKENCNGCPYVETVKLGSEHNPELQSICAGTVCGKFNRLREEKK